MQSNSLLWATHWPQQPGSWNINIRLTGFAWVLFFCHDAVIQFFPPTVYFLHWSEYEQWAQGNQKSTKCGVLSVIRWITEGQHLMMNWKTEGESCCLQFFSNHFFLFPTKWIRFGHYCEKSRLETFSIGVCMSVYSLPLCVCVCVCVQTRCYC